jgi:hypothetical protein
MKHPLRLHRCPACGRRTIKRPGNYEICPCCKWEDDPVQRKDPTFAGGANRLSLKDFSLRISGGGRGPGGIDNH